MSDADSSIEDVLHQDEALEDVYMPPNDKDSKSSLGVTARRFVKQSTSQGLLSVHETESFFFDSVNACKTRVTKGWTYVSVAIPIALCLAIVAISLFIASDMLSQVPSSVRGTYFPVLIGAAICATLLGIRREKKVELELVTPENTYTFALPYEAKHIALAVARQAGGISPED